MNKICTCGYIHCPVCGNQFAKELPATCEICSIEWNNEEEFPERCKIDIWDIIGEI